MTNGIIVDVDITLHNLFLTIRYTNCQPVLCVWDNSKLKYKISQCWAIQTMSNVSINADICSVFCSLFFYSFFSLLNYKQNTLKCVFTSYVQMFLHTHTFTLMQTIFGAKCKSFWRVYLNVHLNERTTCKCTHYCSFFENEAGKKRMATCNDGKTKYFFYIFFLLAFFIFCFWSHLTWKICYVYFSNQALT